MICSLWNNIFEKKFHRIYVLNIWPVKSFCAQYKRGISSLYLMVPLICQFYYRMYWCRCLRRCFRHRSIAFYQISITVSCWKIINCSLSFGCELSLLFFLCEQFEFDIFVTALCFQSKSLVWISIAWNFQSVTFLMQFIKRNFWWHTCFIHFLGNWFDSKVCCSSLC